MAKYEMAMAMVEEMENNNFVPFAFRFADGSEEYIECTNGDEEVVAIKYVTLEQYEANGFEVEGLEGQWKAI